MTAPRTNASHDQNHTPTLLGVSTSDGTTPVPVEVDPATGQMQVNASVSISGADGAILDGANPTIKATVKSLTNSKPLTTQIVDSNGDAITSFGGGTQYADGAVRGSATGTLMMVDDGTNVQSAAGNASGELIAQAKQNGTWNVTNVSGTVSLPTGASTAAKQPALGTAGSASPDVLTVQGIASMTALKVDGSATTQPISAASLPLPSGATTAANQTTMIGNQTNGTQQSKVTDGTNVVSTLKSDGTAAGQNSLMVAPTYLSVAFTSTTNQMVASTDVGNYRWISVQVSSYTGGTATFQVSNDNSNWQSTTLGLTNSGNAAVATAAQSTGVWAGPVSGRYFRINITGISGTLAGTVVFSTLPSALSTIGVSAQLTGSATLADAVANPVVPSLGAYKSSYNGTTWDRDRGNVTGVVIAAGATASNAGVSVTTYNASKGVIVVNISAFTSGSLTVAISGVTSSGYTYPLLTSTALAATGVTPLRIFPSATPSANLAANDMVPRTIQVVTTVSGTLTYGIDYELST